MYTVEPLYNDTHREWLQVHVYICVKMSTMRYILGVPINTCIYMYW